MKKLFLLCLLFAPLFADGQETTERAAVIAAIETIFDGMRAGDSAAISRVFHPAARLQRTYIDGEGVPRLQEGSLQGWLEGVAREKEEPWDEQIWSYDVQIDQRLATVWTEFTFFIGDRLSHCGVNAFQLFKGEDGWKVFQITDTRRQDNCRTHDDDPLVDLNDVIDQWHIAAATADAEAFFGSMTPDAVYIGTDAGERWQRDELRAWSKAAFERDSAWDFKPMARHVRIDEDGRTAWWDEKLDTWMGVCRGSGVLVKTPEGWKIRHYHLAVTVPNEKIERFKELVKE